MKTALALVTNIPSPAVVAKPDRPPMLSRLPAHEELERRLRALRDERKARHRELDAIVEASRSPGTTAGMRALAAEIQTLEAEVRKVRLELAPMRYAFLNRLRAALREPSRATARRALAAIADLEDALASLNGFRGQVRRAGGVAPDLTAKVMLPLAMMLKPIAGGPRKGNEP